MLSLASTIQLFDPQEVLKARDCADSPQQEGLRRVYDRMLERGPERFVSNPATPKVLDEVIADCPNFQGVLQDLSSYLALSLTGKKGLHILPVLLAGDPGVGKTHLAKTLAKALGLPYEFVSMGTVTAGWVLSGSASTWQGAKWGKVAQSLVESQFANPVFLLDELDKATGHDRYDPFGALLQLMEKETASHFKDEYLDVALNASCVVWLATANRPELIPDYILSRMAVYEVPAPTFEQAHVIAQNVYQALLSNLGLEMEPELSTEVLGILGTVPPREMKKRLMDALAHAVKDGRQVLNPQDLGQRTKPTTSRPIGFIS